MSNNTIVRTAYDLERKYNLSDLAGLKKTVEQSANGLIKVDNELNQFVRETADKIDELQDQVDGNITTWFFNGVPTNENQPANEWVEETEKINHLGDLYYDQNTGYAYRWAYIDNEYTWTRIVDADVTEALSVANSAKDTADSKRRTFVAQPTPPYDYGDIWFYNNELYRCQRSKDVNGSFESADWIKATKYTDDSYAESVKDDLDDFVDVVERDYVTNGVFEQTNTGFRSEVNLIRALASEKAQIFKTEPTTPYYVGDLYITGSNIYTCKESKNEGDFDLNDWELNLNGADYVSTTEFEQTFDGFEFDMKKYITDENFVKQKSLNDYIRFNTTADGKPVIELGVEEIKDSDGNVTKVGTGVKAALTSDGLYFVQSGVATSDYKKAAIAYFDKTTLMVRSSINLESVQIGDYIFQPRNNKSLSFNKINTTETEGDEE